MAETLETPVMNAVGLAVANADPLRVMRQLHALPARIAELEGELIKLREERDDFKRTTLARTQAELEVVSLMESMDAPQDGKNAEARKLQLDHHLAQSAIVSTAKEAVHAAEAKLASLEAEVAFCEVDWHQAVNEFKAALVLAELQGRLLAVYYRYA